MRATGVCSAAARQLDVAPAQPPSVEGRRPRELSGLGSNPPRAAPPVVLDGRRHRRRRRRRRRRREHDGRRTVHPWPERHLLFRCRRRARRFLRLADSADAHALGVMVGVELLVDLVRELRDERATCGGAQVGHRDTAECGGRAGFRVLYKALVEEWIVEGDECDALARR